MLVCLPLVAPFGLSPLHILTLCGSERVLVVSTEPPDDLSCLTTPGSAVPETGCCPCRLPGASRCTLRVHAARREEGGGATAGVVYFNKSSQRIPGEGKLQAQFHGSMKVTKFSPSKV